MANKVDREYADAAHEAAALLLSEETEAFSLQVGTGRGNVECLAADGNAPGKVVSPDLLRHVSGHILHLSEQSYRRDGPSLQPDQILRVSRSLAEQELVITANRWKEAETDE